VQRRRPLINNVFLTSSPRRLHDVPAQCGRGQLWAQWIAERHHPAEHEQLLVGDPAATFRAAELQSERAERRAHGESSLKTYIHSLGI